ncbi:MAG: hypothetical protein RL660_2760 [Bacteroidota bacterium]|jgi:Zn-dependent protease with chaperone function
MSQQGVQVSQSFKAQATKSIVAIIFFVLCYLIVLALTLALTAMCVFAGFIIITRTPNALTIGLGLGLAGMGVLILIFLLKFMFKSNKQDQSHLIEVTASQEPELFAMLQDIVAQVGTKFPKKVYLSADVNAAVFYDSNFWSMFFPVKKNLIVGMGLVNSISKDELRAILAHEFGHFAQSSMKLGSYVYNVNQVIHNILYDNNDYNDIMQRWANLSGFFAFFVAIAIKIIQGIQWLLAKLYEIVNKSYFALSREMEFHADEIAASVTGYKPLSTSLLRLGLAEAAYNSVLGFYNRKISDNLVTSNFYSDHKTAIDLLAQENKLEYINGLPHVAIEEQSKYDKSKLVITNQWASHPSTNDRIARLAATGYEHSATTIELANDVFADITATQQQLTQKIFEPVVYSGDVQFLSQDKFREKYIEEIAASSFPKVFNGYYDNKNPVEINAEDLKASSTSNTIEQLYSDEKVDWVYSAVALENDIAVLNGIANKTYPTKSFDYDGVKYRRRDAASLAQELSATLEDVNDKIAQNDKHIYCYFLEAEKRQHKSPQLSNFLNTLADITKSIDAKYQYYIDLSNALHFVSVTTPSDEIVHNFKRIKPIEENIQKVMRELLQDETLTAEIPQEMRENMRKYANNTWEYFTGTVYFEENLKMLYGALDSYAYLLPRKHFLAKKALLDYQADLLQD